MVTVIIDAPDAANYLRAMGLRIEDVLGSVAAGEISRRSCTENDASQAPGFYAWNDTMRSFRDRTANRGWHAERDGLDSLTRDDGRIAIVVATGDEGTGNKNLVPRTKHDRGRETEKAILKNKAHPVFNFAKLDLSPTDPGILPETWLLLIRSTEDGVLCELSRPRALDDSCHVAAWDTRVLLPIVQPDTSPFDRREPDDDGQSIEVTRKAG